MGAIAGYAIAFEYAIQMLAAATDGTPVEAALLALLPIFGFVVEPLRAPFSLSFLERSLP